jgi:6-pyruvoyltetrahydropterin/6-carboxytetrahydropterin synthase
MVALTRRVTFSAAHRYDLPELSPEENARLFGDCARPYGHGHDYACEVTVAGEIDPATGMVLNITDLNRLLQEQVVTPLDGEFLTRNHPFMEGRVPTTENLARAIWGRVEANLTGARLDRVRLQENERLAAECRRAEGGSMVLFTRTYEFSASHRLHSLALSETENRAIFGKCNNPNGHGHNYKLEVTVRGPVDERTGMLIDLGALDRVVNEEVVHRYDHRHLNLDLPEFRDLNPTSENLVRVIWDRLASKIDGARLHRVTIRETERNFFSIGEAEGPPPGDA